MPEILFYNDDNTMLRTSSLQFAMERDLSVDQYKIAHAGRHSFADAIHQNPTVIMIAENIGPISHHMRDISATQIHTMKHYVHSGGTIVLFGGASHFAMNDVIWHWDDGQITRKSMKETFSFVHGQVIGPHHRRPTSKDAPIKHNGCFEVPIVTHEKNTPTALECHWQGNCGQFIIDEDRVHNEYEILATYAQAGKNGGIAAVEVPYGPNGGKYILCSIMPHYKPRSESALWNLILQKIEEKLDAKPAVSMLKRTP